MLDHLNSCCEVRKMLFLHTRQQIKAQVDVANRWKSVPAWLQLDRDVCRLYREAAVIQHFTCLSSLASRLAALTLHNTCWVLVQQEQKNNSKGQKILKSGHYFDGYVCDSNDAGLSVDPLKVWPLAFVSLTY